MLYHPVGMSINQDVFRSSPLAGVARIPSIAWCNMCKEKVSKYEYARCEYRILKCVLTNGCTGAGHQ